MRHQLSLQSLAILMSTEMYVYWLAPSSPLISVDAIIQPYANYTSMQPTSFHGSGTPSSFTAIGIQDAGFPGLPVMGPLGQTPCPGPSTTQVRRFSQSTRAL